LTFDEALAREQFENPVTEPKRSQKSKRPLLPIPASAALQHLWKCSDDVFSVMLDGGKIIAAPAIAAPVLKSLPPPPWTAPPCNHPQTHIHRLELFDQLVHLIRQNPVHHFHFQRDAFGHRIEQPRAGCKRRMFRCRAEIRKGILKRLRALPYRRLASQTAFTARYIFNLLGTKSPM